MNPTTLRKKLKRPAILVGSLSLGRRLALLLCCAVALAGAASTQGAQLPPNLVILLADDLGYGDLGCYGSQTIATPRLDRMAAEGMRFTDFQVAAPFCSPSRAALLTGRLPARCGLPYVLFPAEHTGLPPAEITFAELLKPRGYATACIGKWHLGWDQPFRPQRQGFDVYYGLPYSNDSNEWPMGEPFMQVFGLEPLPLMDGDRVIEAPVDQSTLTKRYTEQAVRFIRQNRAHPFLLYLPHTMPHIPQYASPPFAGKSKAGLYGDAVEEVDWSTGVILDTLRELKLAERTLVIFTSDNGAPRIPANRPQKGRFGERGNGGDNGPLRAGKGTTYEGGVRVPAIAWWPGTVAAGTTVNELTSTLDLFPTLAHLAGAALPADRVHDGRDISPLLRGATQPMESRPLFHYFGVQLQAVRQGDWKLFIPIDAYPNPRPKSLWFDHQPQLFERQHRLWPKPVLYNLREDIGETRDVAAAHPEIVERLTRAAREHDVALQQDKRPMLFIAGPRPPVPQQVRKPGTDLSIWQSR